MKAVQWRLLVRSPAQTIATIIGFPLSIRAELPCLLQTLAIGRIAKRMSIGIDMVERNGHGHGKGRSSGVEVRPLL